MWCSNLTIFQPFSAKGFLDSPDKAYVTREDTQMFLTVLLIIISALTTGLIAVSMGGEPSKPANKELEDYIRKTAVRRVDTV